MSRMRRLCTAFSLAASIALAGCGGETSSGEGDLSDDEIAALVQALTTAGIPMGDGQFLLGPLFGGAELGALGEAAAIGTQISYTVVSGAGTGSFESIGIVGWSGFDAGAGTVDQAFGAMYLFAGESFPSSFEEDLETGDVLVWAYQAEPRTNY